MTPHPANLKPMPLEGLKSLPTLRKMWVGTGGRDLDDETQDPSKGLSEDLIHRRTPGVRTEWNLTEIKRAKDHIQRLPDPGETIHAVVSGRYPLWALIPATIELAAPVTIDELFITTLSFSTANGHELLDMLDAGTVKRATLIVSHYFAATSRYIFDPIAKAIQIRGHRVLAVRNHSKIIGVKLSDGRGLVVEGSANLRSCKNIEQFTLSSDRDLYDFHQQWINGLFDQTGAA